MKTQQIKSLIESELKLKGFRNILIMESMEILTVNAIRRNPNTGKKVSTQTVFDIKNAKQMRIPTAVQIKSFVSDMVESSNNYQTMKALSIKEPYASLMLHGKIETRTWKTNYRGLVLICATLQPFKLKEIEKISGHRLDSVFNTLHPNWSPIKGFAIAVGELIDCRPMEVSDTQKTFVEFNPDLYCHIYKNVRPIKKFKWKGAQGFKNVPESIIQSIEYLD